MYSVLTFFENYSVKFFWKNCNNSVIFGARDLRFYMEICIDHPKNIAKKVSKENNVLFRRLPLFRASSPLASPWNPSGFPWASPDNCKGLSGVLLLSRSEKDANHSQSRPITSQSPPKMATNHLPIISKITSKKRTGHLPHTWTTPWSLSVCIVFILPVVFQQTRTSLWF